MTVISEINLYDFGAWAGAIQTKERILSEDKGDQFEEFIEELYPDGVTDTQLNDLLWFDADWCYEALGISNEDGDVANEDDTDDLDDEDYSEEFDAFFDDNPMEDNEFDYE